MSDSHDPRTWHWPQGVPESLANTEVKMAIRTLSIKKNADHTLTVRANNYTEHISIEGKNEDEVFDAVKWALVCANFDWNSNVKDLVRQELAK